MRRPWWMHVGVVEGLHGHRIVVGVESHASVVLHRRLVMGRHEGTGIVPIRTVVLKGLFLVVVMVMLLIVVHHAWQRADTARAGRN
jgi:hypothetical protein